VARQLHTQPFSESDLKSATSDTMPTHQPHIRQRGIVSAFVITFVLRLLHPQRSRAEDQAQVKYEHYQEDNNRIEVNTASLLFDLSLSPDVSLRGLAVYDAISGATPTGALPPTPKGPVPVVELSDKRYAGMFEVTRRFGRYSITPQLSYSTESDYQSRGLALNQSLELNQKNTTLNLGIAHNFDRILPGNSTLLKEQNKDTTDVMLGITQLLGPKAMLTANFTYGYANGYLADPYKGFVFDYYPGGLLPEKRPDFRSRQVGYLGYTQYITPLNASTELSYRISHDSFGILSHTLSAEWFQKIGRHVIISPSFRYYTQSAADFYMLHFPGDPTLDPTGVPPAYSSDYRLSKLDTFTYGIKAIVKLGDRWTLDAAYHRYEMIGRDNITSPSAYPKANIFTLGIGVKF
jgi:hypothetical protein